MPAEKRPSEQEQSGGFGDIFGEGSGRGRAQKKSSAQRGSDVRYNLEISLEEAFGVGTAATIAHISTIGYEGKDFTLPAVADRKFSPKMGIFLDDYKRGRHGDKFDYLVEI
mgnify:CR=1 FL=1